MAKRRTRRAFQLRERLPEIFGGGLIILLLLLVGFLYLQTRRIAQPPVPPTGPVQKPFNYNPEGYTPSRYIAPLGPEETGGDSFFSAQIRGVVSAWRGEMLTVAVGEDQVEIMMPRQVLFRCYPETMTDSTGATYKPSEVFIDYSKAQVKGQMVVSAIIPEKIPEGDEIMVQVKYTGPEGAEAHFVVGYGCTI